MRKKIYCEYPINLDKKDEVLFKGRESYHISDLRVRFLKNVFIAHDGLYLKNKMLVSKSHFNLVGFADRTFYYSFWKLALEQYLVSTYGKSLTKMKLEKNAYLAIHTKWFGYFFWLTDALPKLIKTQHLHKDIELIYPESWNNIPFVNETLQLFPDLQVKKIKSGVHLQVENLVLPETRQWSNAIDPIELKRIKEFLFEQLEKYEVTTDLGPNIFISRKKAVRRNIINQDEVESLMKKYDYTSICLEDYSFLEQVSILKHAKNVLGLHGAGLANTIFMKENTRIIELSPQIHEKKNLRIPFWRIAGAIKAHFYIIFCKTDSQQHGDLYDKNLIVKINELERCLKETA
jgi:capsular polysaccharide biosynthesis protein